MLRLPEPLQPFGECLDHCWEGMADYVALKTKVASGRAELIEVGESYAAAGRAGALHSIAPFFGNGADVVMAGMTKDELVKVYQQYLVPEEKVGRRIYDAIMGAAKEKCPFCGGIGTPRNLDHFLPKAFFPQFAVLPLNLVPACRDCNMDGKRDDVVALAQEQPIQPYLDDPKFFEEQWVFASYEAPSGGSQGECLYFASPPEHWPPVDRQRAINHFQTFALARRYSVRAAEHLGTLLKQLERLKQRGLSDGDVRHILLQPGVDGAPFANHWKRGMYQAFM